MLEVPKCYIRSCKHYEGVKQFGPDEISQKVICKAFPNGIPVDISYGEDLHLRPTKDQKNEIVYEKSDE